MKINKYVAATILCLVTVQSYPQISEKETGKTLMEQFQNPPIDARPRGLWTWINGNYDSTEIWREIRLAKEKGLGGFDIWDAPTVQDPKAVVPVGPDQVSNEFQRGVGIAVDAARETGYELGYIWNQSVSYIDPEYSHMALYLTTLEMNKSGRQVIKLPFPFIKPHKKHGYKTLQLDENKRPKNWGNVAVLAFPVNEIDTSVLITDQMIDLTSKTDGDLLEWNVPSGKWKILRFVWSRTTENGLTPTPATLKPALDFLNPEATEIHLVYLLDLMERHTGPLENSPIKYLCADSYEFKGLWTPTLPQTFKDSLGYDIIKYLPALEGYTVDDQETTDRFLFDFNNLLSELVIQNHYAKAKEICNRYGIGFTAEAAGPGPPVHMDVPMETIKSSGVLSFPRGEFWVSHGNDSREHLQIIKGIASAAHLYNQPYVTAEAFTGVPLWANGPGDLKPFSDRAFAEGLNRIDFHTFPHTPPEAGLPGWVYSFANIISENLIWWPKAEGFMDYLGRSSYLLQQGNFVGDVLYYHGEKAPYFTKPKHVKPALGLGYDYDIANADILLNQLSVTDGKLVLPHGQHYEILVLPDEDQMSLPVLQKIATLLQNGATIIGSKPQKSPGLKGKPVKRNEAVKGLADKLWRDLDGVQKLEQPVGKGKLIWGKTPREVLAEKGIIPDVSFQTADGRDTLDFIHRKYDSVDIYFLRNPYDREIAADIKVRVKNKQPEIWNPVSGEIKKLTVFQNQHAETHVPLTFSPFDSFFLIFRDEANLQASVTKNGRKIYPASTTPARWAFEDEGSGKIKLLEAGNYIFNTGQERKMNVVSPKILKPENETWKLTFHDPWGETFVSETDELKSWTKFKPHRIKYFSGMVTYENTFYLEEESAGKSKQIILKIDRVEEAAEIFINDESAGLIWNNPGQLKIDNYLKSGKNKLKIEVVNRWPNRMIGDFKLSENERKVKSNIITLPTAWFAPLEQLPNETFPLQESGLLGDVSIVIYDSLTEND